MADDDRSAQLERVRAAAEEFKAALEEAGGDPGTIDAQLNGIIPGEEAVRGNMADLMRMGAIAKTGVMPTPPGQEDIVTDDIMEAFQGQNPDTQAFDDNPSDPAAKPEGEASENMTKADLQAALDDKGIEYPSSATKADLQALLDEG